MHVHRPLPVEGDLVGPLFHREGRRVHRFAPGPARPHQKVEDVGVVDLPDVGSLLGDQMAEGCRRPLPVERPVPIGHEKDEPTPGPQNAVAVDQHGQGIGQVLEDVAGDDEVLTPVG